MCKSSGPRAIRSGSAGSDHRLTGSVATRPRRRVSAGRRRPTMVVIHAHADDVPVHGDPHTLGNLGFRADDYPALFRAADAASRRARFAHTRLIGTELGLLVAAAVAGTLQSFLPETTSAWARALPAVLLAAALIVKLANRLQRFDEQWFDGRAVAETVKTASWRYAMRVRPYDGEGVQPNLTFAEALGETLA